MKREEFLEQWQPYPPMPASAEIGGRLSFVTHETIALSQKGEWKISDLCEFPISVLRPQDWVALRFSDGQVAEITLLAPALEESLKLSSNSEMQKKWFLYLSQVRDFFARKGFQEAQTPTLVECPGTEPFLDFFSTEFQQGTSKKKYSLPTSPELHLKKMLSCGYERIFEMRPCFRNGEITDRHQPEFWMLEWYRAFANLDQILQDSLHLIEFLGGSIAGFKRKSMRDLFKEQLQFELNPGTSIEELKNLAARLGLQAGHYEMWDDVFYLIFIEKVEPFLNSDQPLIVEKYPPSQAALARLTADGWGERFEIYWKGFEIANAFHELNDPRIQALRFQEDLDKKKALGKEIPLLDGDFMKALRSGMPPSSGIALGLERLFMALNGLDQIRDLKVFPLEISRSQSSGS